MFTTPTKGEGELGEGKLGEGELGEGRVKKIKYYFIATRLLFASKFTFE